ncbi:endocuticle structural glycoprotein SgAbd-2-like [Penaeus chinensis]|uniref:endocuticle structural glycoprotein SgAbd-2-like n=1 Tax=Penaeus chinensis TaxID=139456 RepID=UPI001FB5BA30|nr:endocuticle structural glycoprotein SgAbd-2-like [Penaeus chinensis]
MKGARSVGLTLTKAGSPLGQWRPLLYNWSGATLTQYPDPFDMFSVLYDMTISQILVCALVAVVAAAPDHYGPPPTGFYGIPGAYSGPVIPILKDEREGPDASGVYSFEFETGNGIKREEQGAPQGPSGAVAMQGGWSFTFPDGSPAVVSFVADDAGYRVESDLLPTPPPLPAHAIAQIEKARREDAAAAALSGRYSAPRTTYGYP